MNINCINNKIATANGVLQPIILQSIKDIYLNGNYQITARMVRNQCIIIDNNIQWNGKPAAICNAMRNAIECGGNIFGEDRDFLDFTISFDDNGNNLEISTPKKISPKAETNKKEKTNSSSITPYINEIEIEKLTLSKNFKVVMMCSKSKQNDSELIFNNNNNNNTITFKAITNEVINQFKPDDDIPGNINYSWRNYVSNNQNHINLPYRAYELYTENVYHELFMTFGNRLYIESAGWGIVNAEFRLPNYDITFSDNINEETIRHYQAGNFNDYNQLIVSPKDDIIFIGTEKYLPLFFYLTNQLPNRKIIYWKKHNTPINYPIPNHSFIYRRYISNNPRKWFYELANEIADGLIP